MTEQPTTRTPTPVGEQRAPRAGQPSRRAVATYTSYADAERAADRLADLDFPVTRVAIVGSDLETVEQITGKMDYPRAAGRGALAGAVSGALIGWIFGVFSLINPLVAALLLALYGAIFGAVIGAVVGVILYALQRGRRDFASVTMTRPRRFEVIVDIEVADRAAQLLGQGG